MVGVQKKATEQLVFFARWPEAIFILVGTEEFFNMRWELAGNG